MTHFPSFSHLGHHLHAVAMPLFRRNLGHALVHISEAVRDEAHAEIGTTSPVAGSAGYPTWAPLAASTVMQKARLGLGKGGVPESIMYASGKFDQSIGARVNVARLSTTIGTSKQYILYTELGTSKMPPRPVFGPAAVRAIPHCLPMINQLGAYGIAGVTAVPFPQKTGFNGHVFP